MNVLRFALTWEVLWLGIIPNRLGTVLATVRALISSEQFLTAQLFQIWLKQKSLQ